MKSPITRRWYPFRWTRWKTARKPPPVSFGWAIALLNFDNEIMHSKKSPALKMCLVNFTWSPNLHERWKSAALKDKMGTEYKEHLPELVSNTIKLHKQNCSICCCRQSLHRHHTKNCAVMSKRHFDHIQVDITRCTGQKKFLLNANQSEKGEICS